MSHNITGKVIKILAVESGTSNSGNDWKKQNFVIETIGQYPKSICFQVWGDNVTMISNLSQGQEVEVSFDVQSREYNERWYTDLRAYRVSIIGEAQNHEQTQPTNNDFVTDNNDDEDDDLPF